MYTVEQLEKVGGKLWEKNGMRRVYFNRLADWYGLRVEYYKTGNISYAEVDGKRISNNSGRGILFMLNGAKLWYDMEKGVWGWKELKDDAARKIIGRIEEKLNQGA